MKDSNSLQTVPLNEQASIISFKIAYAQNRLGPMYKTWSTAQEHLSTEKIYVALLTIGTQCIDEKFL